MRPAQPSTSLFPLLSVTRQRAVRLFRGLGWFGAYGAWTLGFKMLVLTFVTYFMASSGHAPRFEDIAEVFSANEPTFMGLSALLFVAAAQGALPLSAGPLSGLFTPVRIEKHFIPGFVHGALLAAAVTLAFVLGGTHRYVGFFIQSDEASLAVIAMAVRLVALGSLAYFEEFVFRDRLMRALQSRVWGRRPPGFAGGLALSAGVAILYCAVKRLQFDLGDMQTLTLFLLSLALSTRFLQDGDFGRGAGFWAALLVVFQPMLSLPALGADFPGLALIKYQAPEDGEGRLAQLFTGGAGGPLSGFALQILLAIDVARGMLRRKKRLSNPSSDSLKF